MNNKGFTLIELLVVIAIISIFSSIVFVNYGNTSALFALDRSSQRLSQELRSTEEMALGERPGSGVTGYLVYFVKNATNYIRIADHGDNLYNSSEDSNAKTINLESGVKICTIKYDSTAIDTNLSVSVVAPDPKVYIGNGSYAPAAEHEASITLCLTSDATKTRTVKINSIGRIDITNP